MTDIDTRLEILIKLFDTFTRDFVDAVPGMQMAIDADLNAGTIAEREATDRRLRVSRVAKLFEQVGYQLKAEKAMGDYQKTALQTIAPQAGETH